MNENSTAGGVAIVNSYGVTGYTGPEASTSQETYNFYVYALSAEISATSITDFYTQVEKYKMGVGSFSGVYSNSTLLVF